ncbi:MAG: RimK/LysX family protein [Verrucomicrobiota bacterium]
MSGFNPAAAEDSKRPDAPEKPAATVTEAKTEPEKKPDPKPEVKLELKPEAKPVDKPADVKEVDPDDEVAVEEADAAAVAKPVTSDHVQVYGWREKIVVEGLKNSLNAKLDTGAFTSSIHAEEKELFERDGKKWVKFIVTDPRVKDSPRVRLEAPLVRVARIKDPGGKSETREVVKLSFKIGDRKMRGDFTLNNRSNMLSPILIGRTVIKELGWVDPTRTNLANEKIMP